MNKKIEILAPGGSFKSLTSAIDSGADAVYFGGTRFGARANATNLSNEEIVQAVKYASLRGVKLYVTVNTLADDSELGQVFEFLRFCYTSGVDGVIVQDLGIVNMIRTHFPLFRLHASTQMTVHNLDGVLQAQKMGFDRVVLSRELSFEEIKYIADNSEIELEVFVHGALCMSYSGQCLFSSFLGGRSGNRGQCAQPCRLSYTLLDENENHVSEKDKYLLSLRDLCLVDHIESLKKAGVTSLKIEGRMKSEAYVSAVCGIYKKYSDGGEVLREDKALLENIFSRQGFTKGYYNADYGRDMLSYSSNHDNIYSSVTEDVTKRALTFGESEFKIFLDAKFTAFLGENAVFECVYNEKTYSCKSDEIVTEAVNAPVSKERISDQLSKLGSTVFAFSDLRVDSDENIYISIKEINSMRRRVTEEIERDISSKGRTYDGQNFSLIVPKRKEINSPVFTASVLTGKQAQTAYDIGFEKIYIPLEVYLENPDLYDSDKDVYSVKLPPINHKNQKNDYSFIKTDSVCITNLGHLLNKDRFSHIHADYRINAFNSLSIRELMKWGVKSVTLSPELTISQIKEIGKSVKTEIVVYGRISLMTVRNCLIKSSKGKCGCKKGEIYYLKDRKNAHFPVIASKESCTNVIYNSVPIVMSDRMHELSSCGVDMYRFDFTTETDDEMYWVMKMYESSQKSKGAFTRGHYYNPIK